MASILSRPQCVKWRRCLNPVVKCENRGRPHHGSTDFVSSHFVPRAFLDCDWSSRGIKTWPYGRVWSVGWADHCKMSCSWGCEIVKGGRATLAIASHESNENIYYNTSWCTVQKTCSKAIAIIQLCMLTHWGRVTHICVSKLGHHWLR